MEDAVEITRKYRKLLTEVKALSEERGFIVFYTDIDSMFIGVSNQKNSELGDCLRDIVFEMESEEE